MLNFFKKWTPVFIVFAIIINLIASYGADNDAAFNANIIETGTTIPAQEYAQPAQTPTIGGRNCPHGKMTAIQGMGKDGKPYKGWFCPAPKGAFDKCKNQYVTVQSPEWNTFVPEQIK